MTPEDGVSVYSLGFGRNAVPEMVKLRRERARDTFPVIPYSFQELNPFHKSPFDRGTGFSGRFPPPPSWRSDRRDRFTELFGFREGKTAEQKLQETEKMESRPYKNFTKPAAFLLIGPIDAQVTDEDLELLLTMTASGVRGLSGLACRFSVTPQPLPCGFLELYAYASSGELHLSPEQILARLKMAFPSSGRDLNGQGWGVRVFAPAPSSNQKNVIASFVRLLAQKGFAHAGTVAPRAEELTQKNITDFFAVKPAMAVEQQPAPTPPLKRVRARAKALKTATRTLNASLCHPQKRPSRSQHPPSTPKPRMLLRETPPAATSRRSLKNRKTCVKSVPNQPRRPRRVDQGSETPSLPGPEPSNTIDQSPFRKRSVSSIDEFDKGSVVAFGKRGKEHLFSKEF